VPARLLVASLACSAEAPSGASPALHVPTVVTCGGPSGRLSDCASAAGSDGGHAQLLATELRLLSMRVLQRLPWSQSCPSRPYRRDLWWSARSAVDCASAAGSGGGHVSRPFSFRFFAFGRRRTLYISLRLLFLVSRFLSHSLQQSQNDCPFP